MSKKITKIIEFCEECPFCEHTGAFTKGGAKPCCNHDAVVLEKGDNCFDRVIPYKECAAVDRVGERPSWITKKIPDWCPLEG